MFESTSEIASQLVDKSRIKDSYIHAEVLNLKTDGDKKKLKGFTEMSMFRVLDVGPGYNPILSVDLKAGDVYVGVDPALSSSSLKRGNRTVEAGTKLFLVNDSVDAISPFKAELIMLVAPNPEDIVNGLLYQLEDFCQSGTQIIILLDNRTVESRERGNEAKRKIVEFFKDNGFKPSGLNLKGRNIDTSGSKDAIGGTFFKAIKR